MSKAAAWLELLRPYQWTKNLFVLAPLVFGRRLLDPPSGGQAAAGFVLFCSASSAAYILNDILDVESDRLHPVKKERPLAAGAVAPAAAAAVSLALGAAAVAGALILSRPLAAAVALYLALNIAYSVVLKHVVILDVLAVAGGFLLRVLGGAWLLAIEPSEWLILCALLLALFLGFGKRRQELVLLSGQGGMHRRVLQDYSPYFLDQLIGVVTASTVVCYMLYTMSDRTVRFFGTRNLVWTVPFVLYGIFRYLYLIHHRNRGGDPARVVISDAPLLGTIVLWLAACLAVIYLF